MRTLNFLFILSFFLGAKAFASVYQDGDIIFHESQSNQSKAIQEVTNSRWSHVGILFSDKNQWYVAEAVQPVKITPLASFIGRGKNKEYRIYRLPSLSETQRLDLKKQVSLYLGQNYDIYFEWSDDLIYCSELVYKTFLAATGIEIGTVQKFRDLKLDGPYAKELIRRRIIDTGRTLDPEENIVTPASQALDSKLELIEQSE